VQRGHGIGDILGSLWRFVRPLLWTGAKSLGKETLKTGSQLLCDLADKPANVSAHDIITASAQNLEKDCVEPERGVVSARIQQGFKKKYKEAKIGAPIKETFFPNFCQSRHIPVRNNVAAVASETEMASVNAEFDIFAPKLVRPMCRNLLSPPTNP
jgi:hypothetical protein